MSDLTIRPARAEDTDAVFGLLTQFVTSYLPDRAAFDRHYPVLVSSSQSIFFVAALGNDVVGYALGSIALTLYANGHVLEIQELMVASEHRDQGIGRRLVEAALERALAAGCIEATAPTRRARDFYVGLGFEETATYLKRRLTP
jgi:ribosomal protein S18 acetylase RimI-like enzyme